MSIFDINYGELNASITGTNLNTSTADFAFDNRSDAGNTTWTSISGTFHYDWGTSAGLVISDIFINNTNMETGYVELWTGTAYAVAASYTSIATSSIHMSFTTVTSVSRVRITNSTTASPSATAYAGEIIATRRKFTLGRNPNRYRSIISPVLVQKNTWDGRTIFNERSRSNGVFSAEIGWDFLEGAASNSTDAVNITELARKRTSFLFWPNAGNANQDGVFTWRGEDMYKCKIGDAVTYEFSNNNLTNYISTDFLIQEIK